MGSKTVVLLLLSLAWDTYGQTTHLDVTSRDYGLINSTHEEGDRVCGKYGVPDGEPYILRPKKSESNSLVEGWHKMTTGFIHSVSDGPPMDVLLNTINGEDIDVKETVLKVLKAEAGYVACLAFGILFILVMIISCCSVICCRCCCGKCGGKRVQRDKPNIECRRNTYSTLLFISLTFMVVGATCGLLDTAHLKTSLAAIDETSIDIIDEVKTFVSNTNKQMKYLSVEGVAQVLDCTVNKLEGVGNDVGDPIIEKARVELERLIENSEPIQADLKDSTDGIESLIGVIEELNNLGRDSQAIVKSVNDFKVKCTSPECATLDPNILDIQRKFDKTTAEAKLQDLREISIKKELDAAKLKLDEIPDMVKSRSDEFQKSLTDQFENFQEKIASSPFFTRLENETTSLEQTMTDAKAELKKVGDAIRKYDVYRYWGMTGLLLLVLIPTCLMLVGLCFGLVGKSPSHYRQPANRNGLSHCGGLLLMIGVHLLFVFSCILMLITILLFQLGAHTETYGCSLVRDSDYRLLDRFYIEIYKKTDHLKTDLFNTSTVIPSQLFKGCRDGKTVFQLLDLRETLKLDEYLDLESVVNVDEQVEKLDLGELVETVGILDQVDRDRSKLQLDDFISDLQKFVDEDTFSGDPTKLLEDLKALKSKLSGQPLEPELDNIISELQTFIGRAEDFKRNKIDITVKNLKAKLEEIEINSEKYLNAIPAQVDAMKFTLTTFTKEEVKSFGAQLLQLGQKYVNFVQQVLEKEVGKCDIATNIYDVTVKATCDDLLDPLNGYWFGLGCCLFFEIFAIAFGIKLSKHFLRMDPLDSLSSSRKHKKEDSDDEMNGYEIVQGGSKQEVPMTHISISLPTNNSGPQTNKGYQDDRLNNFQQY